MGILHLYGGKCDVNWMHTQDKTNHSMLRVDCRCTSDNLQFYCKQTMCKTEVYFLFQTADLHSVYCGYEMLYSKSASSAYKEITLKIL